jgi:L-alanine-DL-glutamate epimerase-like enolase superfamily enzyme
MARARTEFMNSVLVGQDPVAIESLFFQMTGRQDSFVPEIPVVSGIDIALWDLAGKIIGQPAYRLLGGPMRSAVPIYSHGLIDNPLDPVQCKDWAQKVKAEPEGFNTFKFMYMTQWLSMLYGVGERQSIGRWPLTLDGSLEGSDLHKVARGYANIRNAVGDDIDIAFHATGQFNLPNAIAISKAIEPVAPAWFEDPLMYVYSDAWAQLKRATRVPILTGEKVEMVAGFKPYLDNAAVDIVHPDVAFSGGITGCRKIADYAALTHTPMALHSGPASLIRLYASVHLGAAVQNFFKIENALGEWRGYKENMAAGKKPVVRNSVIALPEGPGLGLQLNEDWLKQHLLKGEPYWS